LKKKLSLILFVISISCYLLFFLLGSKIGENGYLDEPFFLLPLGALFFFASAMLFAWTKIKGL
jgi:lipopolysaccharide export LptBFGC system permease protein LptF